MTSMQCPTCSKTLECTNCEPKDPSRKRQKLDESSHAGMSENSHSSPLPGPDVDLSFTSSNSDDEHNVRRDSNSSSITTITTSSNTSITLELTVEDMVMLQAERGMSHSTAVMSVLDQILNSPVYLSNVRKNPVKEDV